MVREIFGLHLDAICQRLVVSPLFPSSWPDAVIRGVRMSQVICDAVWDGESLRIHMTDSSWTVVASDIPPDAGFAWELYGAEVSPDGGRDWVLRPRSYPWKELLA